MKRFWYICLWCLFLMGCTKVHEHEDSASIVPSGTVEVRFVASGILTTSPDNATPQTKFTPDSETLDGKPLIPLEEGSTLWLMVDGTKDADDGSGTGTVYHTLKSYVVRGVGSNQYLYPCTVDEKGNVIDEGGTQLFIPYGTYTFRALSPARAFRDEHGNVINDISQINVYRQLVNNGDYMISNDERYTQTSGKMVEIKPSEQKVQVVELSPVINQTAQLKFTITTDESLTLQVLSAGVESSGLQSMYGKEDDNGDLVMWNWSPNIADTLIAYPGMKDEYLTLRRGDPRISFPNSHTVVMETAILPTDATSNPLFILLNLAVNDYPTQYQMTLNQKIFRSGYSYHYKGKITINDGVTVLTWQTVAWEKEIEIEVIE